MSFLVSDGVFPTNEGRGYVVRRVIRRAVRHAYLLDVDHLVTPSLVDTTVEVMGEAYPALVKSHDYVRDVVAREEERFRQTLQGGHGHPRRRARRARPGRRAAGSRRLHAPRHARLPARADPRDRARARRRGRRGRLRARHGRAAPAGQGRPHGARAPTPTSRCSRRPSRSSGRPSSWAASSSRSRRGVLAVTEPDDEGRVSIVLDRIAVLRRERRPGRRHGHDHQRDRPGRGARHDLRAARAAPPPGPRRRGLDRDRRDRHRRDRRRAPRRHPPQPHRHPPPALGAAPGARRPRQAAGLARRPRPAALRLQPLRGGVARRAGPHRGPGQPRDPGQPAGPPLRDHQGLRRAAGRHRLLRRQVRRHRARARGRAALDRAVRRHPRAGHRRHRPGQDRERELDRLEPAPHRGHHRVRSDRAPATRRGPAGRGGRPARAWPTTTWSTRSSRRVAENKELRDELRDLRRQAAAVARAGAGRGRRRRRGGRRGSTAWPATTCASSRWPCATSRA